MSRPSFASYFQNISKLIENFQLFDPYGIAGRVWRARRRFLVVEWRRSGGLWAEVYANFDFENKIN
jgi:hypothetical protein